MSPSRTFLILLGLLFVCLVPPGLAQSIQATQDYKLGRVLASGGRWEEALVALERALKEDANHADALYSAGLCHANPSSMTRCRSLRRVTELRPEFLAAWGHSRDRTSCRSSTPARTLGSLGRFEAARSLTTASSWPGPRIA